MKTTKRFASLFLAMLMAFSLMAVTASACDAGHAHDETCAEATVQPRRPAAWCHSCGQAMIDDGIVWVDEKRCVAFHCATCPNTAVIPW